MSLLSSFITEHVVSLLEAALVKHEPELQAKFIAEIEQFAGVVGDWLKEKLLPESEPE